MTFPVVALPQMGTPSSTFELDPGSQDSSGLSGAMASVGKYPALWSASIVTKRLLWNQVQAWQAWGDDVKAFCKLVEVHDPARPMPYEALLNGIGGWDGAGTFVHDGSGGMTISGVPANYQFRQGDWVGTIAGDFRGLFRLTADIAADGLGVVTGAAVAPGPDPIAYPNGTAVNFLRPVMKAKLDAVQAQPSNTRTNVTLRFLQVLA